MSEQPRLRSVSCFRAEGFRRMVYWEWGNPHNKNVVLCVHGLTRNGRDFDWLARALSDRYRVICPDVLGRGQSDWLDDPAGYSYAHYLADMATLIARSGAETVDWIGTSMGGLIGMMLAVSDDSPIRRLVLNDVGAFIPKAAVERLQAYVGKDPTFPNQTEAERYLRVMYQEFGDLTDEQWGHLTRNGMRLREDGLLSPAYDPAIAEVLNAQPAQDVVMWPLWDAVACPVLVLRGANSQLLLPETVGEMRKRGPGCEVEEFEGVGHAPALMDADQIHTIDVWLLDQDARDGEG
ncbi:alpha/beta fold hydrolase [Novispirillum sp. DQ9]|uniref:alpha/beta fold hydrolase n=1 Tax=Novispirillum sp. DQ9 TaxID=3398612 RepID=UPI003C7A1BD7